ncbi:HAMP domain-containing sensor histidine kinase [Desulfococcaceae bacterium HSG8]|nr:HAMP domain-containing sensor histidine kinase [Desulfococcaceae bacterium HSG8]
MRRLKLLILIFCVTLSVPLAYFVLRTYRSLEQEEISELRYFAETLFNEMEGKLADLVRKEEARAVDEYNYYQPHADQGSGSGARLRSPLSRVPEEKNFIIGYFQNNPDGSFQTPLLNDTEPSDKAQTASAERLRVANLIFNQKRVIASERLEYQPAKRTEKTLGKKMAVKEEVAGLADKYLNLPRYRKQKSALGQEKKRVERISVKQALNISQQDKNRDTRQDVPSEQSTKADADQSAMFSSQDSEVRGRGWAKDAQDTEAEPREEAEGKDFSELQVEVDPMQAVFINDRQVFMFRRIGIRNQIFRQGFLIDVNAFLGYLADACFAGQPISRFTRLKLMVMDGSRETAAIRAGIITGQPILSLDRTFPRPFSFLEATLVCGNIPRSAGRRTLNIMVGVLGAVILAGLFAIYRSARMITDMSERRAKFVSSVTHELKTPLTNIRMYIEMLEQGIARTPEREAEYFSILSSESARLSRLISNVLEFSKLEKKQIRLDLREGTFEDVICEVRNVMGEKLRQEGFQMNIERKGLQPFVYDREVMIQVLINLIENSIKFGKSSEKKEITLGIAPERGQMNISVSDTGPGIPRHGLKRVFDDFYRADSSLTRTTRGTGIGLAFVKKFVTAARGTVSAANNDGPGCTITLSLGVFTSQGSDFQSRRDD